MAHGQETGSGKPALRQALQARGLELDLIFGLPSGPAACEPHQRPHTCQHPTTCHTALEDFSCSSTGVHTSRNIEDDHAAVAVAVCDVDLVGLRVHLHIRGAAKALSIVAAPSLSVAADLLQEAAVAREFQQDVVICAVAGDPDIVLMVYVDTVLVLWPSRVVARPAPGLHQVALRVEFEHGRGRDAAVRARWDQRCAALIFGQAARPVDHPYMVAPIGGDPGCLSDLPAVR